MRSLSASELASGLRVLRRRRSGSPALTSASAPPRNDSAARYGSSKCNGGHSARRYLELRVPRSQDGRKAGLGPPLAHSAGPRREQLSHRKCPVRDNAEATAANGSPPLVDQSEPIAGSLVRADCAAYRPCRNLWEVSCHAVEKRRCQYLHPVFRHPANGDFVSFTRPDSFRASGNFAGGARESVSNWLGSSNGPRLDCQSPLGSRTYRR